MRACVIGTVNYEVGMWFDVRGKMKDPRHCSKCGADVEETYTARICQGCGIEEIECECD